ncbi:MAG TPA: outer membrane lipid asymmetry maintenance protein MlaD [Alphaproteobacteria bacterium]|nr:outer membrane lipid asymmetry maintenance protein MlaD [Alphaproteobacteria bacterium]
MGRNLVETLLGAIVLVVAGLFLVFAYSSTNIRAVNGYEVIAKFERVDGLATGSDVKLSGIKVGTVVEQKLEPQTYLAVVKISIDGSVKLPTDTVAQVVSEGLLGSNFIALVPGAEEQTIPPGGEIKFTQAPVNIVQLLGKFIFSAGENQGPVNSGAQGGSPRPPAPKPQ